MNIMPSVNGVYFYVHVLVDFICIEVVELQGRQSKVSLKPPLRSL